MSQRKKKILMCSEASYITSGFGTYTNEILRRLHNSGKFEVAEFASYAVHDDERIRNVPWKFYANAVPGNDPRYNFYKSRTSHEFGEWRFERVLLDFQPDIVWDVRDIWMFIYQQNSPFRPYFHWCVMPTVDSAPQQEDWIDTFINADSVFTWSDFGKDTLLKEGGGLINLHGTASYGVNTDIFKPVLNKVQHRRDMGFVEDSFIIGTVMRNQKRKLFPDLIQSFSGFLDKCEAEGNHALAQKTFLYLHTSYPDLGWDIPRLIKESGIGHKILFSYICKECHNPFASFFQDARTVCPFCRSSTAILPSTGKGLTQEDMAKIFNLFDVYVQYSICEGLGMPQVEAAACGIPVMAVDYSAMADVVRKVGGYPIKVERMFREMESGAYRALPDNQDLVNQLYKFLTQPESLRRRRGFQARKGVEQHYNWDTIGQTWEDHFDSIVLTGKQGKWDSAPNIASQSQPIPDNLSNHDFVQFCIHNILQEPRLEHSYLALQLVHNLNYGAMIDGGKLQEFTRNNVIDLFTSMTNNKNVCEQARCGLAPLSQDDFIHSANNK